MHRAGARQEPGSPGHRKRLERIGRRADPSVKNALQNGFISARKADELLYLPPEIQQQKISDLLAEQTELARRGKLAVRVIKAHIDAGRHDLAGLGKDLLRELSTSSIESHA
jgi:hypothetical protein